MKDNSRMDEKNQMDNSAQLVKEAKEKLLWYTSEAGSEEFDEDAVATLVSVVAKWDDSFGTEDEDDKKLKEQFLAYCSLYNEDEEKRKTLKNYSGSKDLLIKKNSGRIGAFGRKGIAITVAAACIVLLIITGSTRDLVNAGEDSGFFHWLKKDKEGILAVTSPEKVGLDAEEKYENVYSNIEDVPEKYQQYLLEKENFAILEDFVFQNVECVEIGSVHRVREIFISNNGDREIRIGILIYEDETMIAGDKFVNYEFLYTINNGEKELDVYKKVEEGGAIKYLVSFYEGNKKCFVSGNENVEFLESILEEYVDVVFERK